MYIFIGVFFDYAGHLRAVMAQTDHGGEVVVECAAENIADGDRNKCDRTEKDSLDRAENWAGTGDVEQVDKAVSPTFHGDVVDAVIFGISRSCSFAQAENLDA